MSIFLRGRRRVATGTLDISAMKAKQSQKICELRSALIAEGFRTLDEQAEALGLCRSTAWTILKGQHKASGLSAAIINRVLAAPQLPPLARLTVLEYVREKAVGLYGHGNSQRRRFIERLTVAQGEAENAFAFDGMSGHLVLLNKRERKGELRRDRRLTFGAFNVNSQSRSYGHSGSDAGRPSTMNDSRSATRGRSHKIASAN